MIDHESPLYVSLMRECWQCATQQGPFVQGVHLLCNDCDAGERREYAEQERDE